MERSYYYIASGDNGQEHGKIESSGCACTPTGIRRKVTVATRGIPFRKDTEGQRWAFAARVHEVDAACGGKGNVNIGAIKHLAI